MAAAPPSPAPPIAFGPDGLIPAVVQDAASGDVLMVGFMNEAALAATRATGRAHFWSRSRQTLWRKGETSGHEQVVEAIYVNCERNSLLLQVRQVGAVCHDGYPTCYYRRLEPDDRLTVVRERAFDPAAVYGPRDAASEAAPPPDAAAPDRLGAATRALVGAFAFLRDNDLSAASGTSARLRSAKDHVSGRVADELRELAGVLDGSHRHTGLQADVLLEGTQVVYWLVLSALRAGATWSDLRPDRALATHDALDIPTVARLLRAESRRWALAVEGGAGHVARCHAALALVGQACHAAGVAPLDVVESDLTALRRKPYLAPYFTAPERTATGDEAPDQGGSQPPSALG